MVSKQQRSKQGLIGCHILVSNCLDDLNKLKEITSAMLELEFW